MKKFVLWSSQEDEQWKWRNSVPWSSQEIEQLKSENVFHEISKKRKSENKVILSMKFPRKRTVKTKKFVPKKMNS
jgi:hypothetical protein